MYTQNHEIEITGHIGRDPEYKTLNSGKRLLTFSLACSTRTGQSRDDITVWWRVQCWEEAADWFDALGLRTGMKISVVGAPRASAYIGNDGQPRATLELNINRAWNCLALVQDRPRAGRPSEGGRRPDAPRRDDHHPAENRRDDFAPAPLSDDDIPF